MMPPPDVTGECAKCRCPATVREVDLTFQFDKRWKEYWLPRIKYEVADNGCEHDMRFRGRVAL